MRPVIVVAETTETVVLRECKEGAAVARPAKATLRESAARTRLNMATRG